jgi:chemotaxis protein methyltransferase CheR
MSEEISHEDLSAIVQLIRAEYGYDFSGYSEASLKRRFVKFCRQANVSLFELKYNIVNDRTFFLWMLQSLTVNVTEMFRDPSFYKALREEILPALSTYPIIKIWHAGCSTGEEAYSMAIMLHEAGLLQRSKIYATDMNMANLEKANEGIIPLTAMKDYTANYQQAGGTADFADYYTARYDHAIINKELRRNILFTQHNLVTDYVFNEFQLICCRNVMIYFNSNLQNRVLNLFYQSLVPLGYLGLGIKESMLFADCKSKFETVNSKNKIYRLKG